MSTASLSAPLSTSRSALRPALGLARRLGLISFLVLLSACSSYEGRERSTGVGTIAPVLNPIFTSDGLLSFDPDKSNAFFFGESNTAPTRQRYTYQEGFRYIFIDADPTSGVEGEEFRTDLPDVTENGRAIADPELLVGLREDLSELTIYDLRRDFEYASISEPFATSSDSSISLNEAVLCELKAVEVLLPSTLTGGFVTKNREEFFVTLSSTDCSEADDQIAFKVTLRERASLSTLVTKLVDDDLVEIELPGFELSLQTSDLGLANAFLVGTNNGAEYGYVGYDEQTQQVKTFNNEETLIHAIDVGAQAMDAEGLPLPRFKQYRANNFASSRLYLDWGWNIWQLNVDSLFDDVQRRNVEADLQTPYFERLEQGTYTPANLSLGESRAFLNQNHALYLSLNDGALQFITQLNPNARGLNDYRVFAGDSAFKVLRHYSDRDVLSEIAYSSKIEDTLLTSSRISVAQIGDGFYVSYLGDLNSPEGARTSIATTFDILFIDRIYRNSKWLIMEHASSKVRTPYLLTVDEEQNAADGKLINPALYTFDEAQANGRGGFVGNLSRTNPVDNTQQSQVVIDDTVGGEYFGALTAYFTFFSDLATESKELFHLVFTPRDCLLTTSSIEEKENYCTPDNFDSNGIITRARRFSADES